MEWAQKAIFSRKLNHDTCPKVRMGTLPMLFGIETLKIHDFTKMAVISEDSLISEDAHI